MDNRKIVFNNEQYSILTNIKIGSSTFLICIDAFDKKVVYFKQEAVDGKVKLITSSNIVTTASDLTKKSMNNKKRMMDAFCIKVEELLASCVFVDRVKLASLFKNFTRDIDACDLKYYIIDNASIEPSDESIQKVVERYNEANVTKDLEQADLAQNELYYFSNESEKEVTPKEQSIANTNNLNLTPATEKTTNFDNLVSSDNSLLPDDSHLFDNVDEMMKNTTANIPVPEPEPVVEISEEDLKKRKKKNIIIISVVLVLLAGFLASYFLLFNKKVEKKTNKSIVNRLLNIVELKEDKNGEPFNKPQKTTENYLYYMDLDLFDVDFDALAKENEDTIAWIKIDSLGISYPVVISEDGFYKENDYDKEASSDGWIYVEDDVDFLSYNTVIYGAAASDGSLFGHLKNTLEAEWLRDYKNYTISISSKEVNTLWQIASVYEVKNDDLDIKTEFKDDEDFLKYYSSVVKSSTNQFSVIPNEDDRLITLVSEKDSETKVVVVAKLIKANVKIKGVSTNEDEEDDEVKTEVKDDEENIKKEETKTDEIKEETKNEEKDTKEEIEKKKEDE